MPNNSQKKREEKLLLLKRQEEEQAAQRKADKLNIPYKDPISLPGRIEDNALMAISEQEAQTSRVIGLNKTGKIISVAAEDPNNPQTSQIIGNLKNQGYKIEIFLVSKSSFDNLLKQYAYLKLPEKETPNELILPPKAIEDIKNKAYSVAGLQNLLNDSTNFSTSTMIEIIISTAVAIESSDIHLEPSQDQTKIRFRIDGILQDIGFLNAKQYNPILSRIKLLSGLKLNIHDEAQDGRFSINTIPPTEIRTSVLPETNQEAVVLRILNPKTISLSLEDLGFRKDAIEIMKKEIQRPNGLILTTGPTGSGKTTTLYAFLKKINRPEIKIITIEDPIEYHLTGIEQTQVNPDENYDFANGLRSILRQDPDVIMVGEIRDEPTAQIAVDSSLTGHLVLSTLHTNDSSGAIPRLIDLNVKTELIPPALRAVIAQRLLRKLCEICKIKTSASKEEAIIIKKALGSLPENFHIKFNKKIYKPNKNGCSQCNKTSYKGRIGVIEIFTVDKEMEKTILTSPSHIAIRTKAQEKGMITMYQDAIIKVVEGITSFEEVIRVVGIEE